MPDLRQAGGSWRGRRPRAATRTSSSGRRRGGCSTWRYPQGPLPLERGRNPDFHELTLRGATGEPLLSFALAYGFRNIQNVVRNLKRGKSKYHYVEVLACPSGCLNGGGQVKPPAGTTNKELLQALEASYGTNFGFRAPSASPGAAAARRALEDAGVDTSAGLRTEYHAVEKAPPVLTALSNW